jgi:hypothetical protein
MQPGAQPDIKYYRGKFTLTQCGNSAEAQISVAISRAPTAFSANDSKVTQRLAIEQDAVAA